MHSIFIPLCNDVLLEIILAFIVLILLMFSAIPPLVGLDKRKEGATGRALALRAHLSPRKARVAACSLLPSF